MQLAPQIQFIQDDLIQLFKRDKTHVLIHGCNCLSTMGKSIALYIRREFPHAYQADKQFHLDKSQRLGKFSYWKKPQKAGWIINAYTQYNYKSQGFHPSQKVDLFSYDTFEQQMKDIFQFLNKNWQVETNKTLDELVISMPMIGCGLAGGNAVKIVSMLINAFNDVYGKMDKKPKMIIAEKNYQAYLDFCEQLKTLI